MADSVGDECEEGGEQGIGGPIASPPAIRLRAQLGRWSRGLSSAPSTESKSAEGRAAERARELGRVDKGPSGEMRE